MVGFKTLADLYNFENITTFMPYIPMSEVNATEYEEGMRMVRNYDPDNNFVVIACVDIKSLQRIEQMESLQCLSSTSSLIHWCKQTPRWTSQPLFHHGRCCN